MAFTAEYIYRILDRYSGPLDRISRSTNKFRKSAAAAAGKVDRLSGRLERTGQMMSNFQNVIGGAAITAGIFKFAQSSSNLADRMADVQRVTNMTDTELERMRVRLQMLGRETGRSALGFADIAYEGGKLGIVNKDLAGFVLMVTKTAAAFDMVDSEAGRSIGSIRAKLALSIPAVNALLQRVNYLADNTSATGNQMIEIIERTSGTFKTLNIPPEVTAGWAAFANQVEVTPELAASGLNMMMAKMMQMPGMLDKMLKDPKNAVVNFLKRFESMPEAKRGAMVLRTFGLEAGRFVLKAVSNTKLLDEAMQKAASTQALGSMDREFANILKRSSTAAKRIKETFIDISRAIGSVFIKVFDKYSARIQKITEFVLKFVKAHPGLVKIAGITGVILAGITAIIVPLGIMFTMIATGLPVISGLLAAISGISLPILAAVAAVAGWVTWLTWAYVRSAAFRQSLLNLADALKPIGSAIKTIAIWLADVLGVGFQEAGDGAERFGNVLSVIIDLLAALIKTFTRIPAAIGGTLGALSTGDFGGAWDALKTELGFSTAKDKAVSRSQDNKMEISGNIGVSAAAGSKVEEANINLDTGYNLAKAH